MSEVIVVSSFRRAAKPLLKKYPSLKAEIEALIDLLEVDPVQGTFLGRNCYKIRIAISSKGKGKSGGARVITYFQIVEDTVHLLTIYDKSERENLPDHELDEVLRAAGLFPE